MVFGSFLYTLQDHGRLADTSRTEYAHQTTIPTDVSILIAHECSGHLPQQFAHVLIKFQFYHSSITFDSSGKGMKKSLIEGQFQSKTSLIEGYFRLKHPSLRDLSSDMGLGHALSSAYGKHRHIAGSHFPILSFSLEFPATMGMEKRWAYGSLSTSAKVLEYSRGSTRVLSGQYSSTSIGVLEYSYWSTRVFLLKYSDALRSSPPTPLFSSTKDGR